MLKIRQVRKYNRAKYPRGTYERKKRSPLDKLAKHSVFTMLLLALQEACDSGGVSGPPPLPPAMITESDARLVINRVFTNQGIDLDSDVPFVLKWSEQDSLVFEVDGFNDSLQVGYEYYNWDDEPTEISADAREALEDAIASDGPYIKFLHASEFEVQLEQQVEEFIATLRANGVI